MVLEVLTLGALVLGAAAWRADRARLQARLLDDERVRALPVELALWWQGAGGGRAADRSVALRRATQRVEAVARALGHGSATVGAVQLAIALPPGILAEPGLALPVATRRALSSRHARWDGTGIPDELRGSAIPIEAQLLSLVDWLEIHDGSPPHTLTAALRAERGRRFAPELVRVAAEHLPELRVSSFLDVSSRFRVTEGALLVVTPEGIEHDPSPRREQVLSVLDQKLRSLVRPTDRVFCTDHDVVVWLAGVDAQGAMGTLKRIEPIVARVAIPGIEVGAVACGASLALADTDATSFTELLAVARERARRRAEVSAG